MSSTNDNLNLNGKENKNEKNNKVKIKNDNKNEKDKILSIVKNIWGYDSIKDEQMEVISSILENKSTLAVLPTGFGKSICFQVPALLKNGLTIIITPLISLMEDQVNSFNGENDNIELLKSKGIAAVYINSALSGDEKKEIYKNLFDNQYKLMYITPERFVSEGFIDFISKIEISQIVIDEIHCIVAYGKSLFRPAYLELGNKIKLLLKKQKELTISGFSATVSLDALDFIEKSLGFNFQTKVIGNTYKNNIAIITKFYETKKLALQKTKEICLGLKDTDGKILIFGGSIKDTRDLSKILKEMGLNASYYYAGLSAETKTKLLKNFKSGKIKFLCATSAFGMGIDISDIRVVIHYSIPGSMEAYIQEIGRAGRDLKPAVGILIGCKKDVVVSRSMLFGKPTYFEDKIKLDKFVDFIKNDNDCKVKSISESFNNEFLGDCGKCSSCIGKIMK